MKYYKVLNAQECHNGFQYREGLNVDTVPFEPAGSCRPGGLYYAREDILMFIHFGDHIREVTVPEGARTYENPRNAVATPRDCTCSAHKWKSDRIVLGSRREINLQTIRELVEEGANYHVHMGGEARSLLLIDHMVNEGKKDVVDYLIGLGETPNEKVMNQCVYSAAYRDDTAWLDRIVASGAYPTRDIIREVVRSTKSVTAIRWALDLNETLGKNQKRTINDIFGLASRQCDVRVMREILERGADPHACDDVWFRRALARRNLGVVEYFANTESGFRCGAPRIDITKFRPLIKKFLRRYQKEIRELECSRPVAACFSRHTSMIGSVREGKSDGQSKKYVYPEQIEAIARAFRFELHDPSPGRESGEIVDMLKTEHFDAVEQFKQSMRVLEGVHCPSLVAPTVVAPNPIASPAPGTLPLAPGHTFGR